MDKPPKGAALSEIRAWDKAQARERLARIEARSGQAQPEEMHALVEVQTLNRHAYLDTYPSGRHYVACGFPHARRSFEGRCSTPWPHEGREHINRDGNQWSGEKQCRACGCAVHVNDCNGWVSNGWNQHGCHCQENA